MINGERSKGKKINKMLVILPQPPVEYTNGNSRGLNDISIVPQGMSKVRRKKFPAQGWKKDE